MRLGFKRLWGWEIAVLLWGMTTFASAEDLSPPVVTVLVFNSAGVPLPVLGKAEVDAAQIFRAAGIEIEWLDCSDRQVVGACRRVPVENQFVLHIVPTGKTSTDSVFGVAFLGENGAGKYCDVFFDRVEGERLQFGTNISQLLGAVAAHELGHLLLGSKSHARIGLMTAIWKEGSLRQIGMGTLLFTSEQAVQMKARMSRQNGGSGDFVAKSGLSGEP